MKAILTAAWAITLLVTALPAAAAQPDLDTRTVKVDYSDLNLTSPRGVSRLQNRVSGAISQVCGGPAFSQQESVQQRACESKARTTASRDVRSVVSSARQSSSTTERSLAPSAAEKTISSSTRQSSALELRRH